MSCWVFGANLRGIACEADAPTRSDDRKRNPGSQGAVVLNASQNGSKCSIQHLGYALDAKTSRSLIEVWPRAGSAFSAAKLAGAPRRRRSAP
jgi:hypothetical protein